MIDKVADETVTVSRWLNAFQFVFEQPSAGTPTLTIHYEVCEQEADGPVISTSCLPIVIPYTNPDTSFPLYNVDTGLEIGTMTHGEIYRALYSLFKNQTDAAKP